MEAGGRVNFVALLRVLRYPAVYVTGQRADRDAEDEYGTDDKHPNALPRKTILLANTRPRLVTSSPCSACEPGPFLSSLIV